MFGLRSYRYPKSRLAIIGVILLGSWIGFAQHSRRVDMLGIRSHERNAGAPQAAEPARLPAAVWRLPGTLCFRASITGFWHSAPTTVKRFSIWISARRRWASDFVYYGW